MIPKGEGCKPLDLRPITVTPIAYRLWASMQMKNATSWQESWIHEGQHGARANHGSVDLLASLTVQLDEAILNGHPIFGVAVDLAKDFDNRPVEITFAVLEAMGMDRKIMLTLKAMYTQLRRRFKIGKYVGDGFCSTNGILQGCPLSVMLLNAVMCVLHWVVVKKKISPESFVDDLTLLSRSPVQVGGALYAIREFMQATAQELNVKKQKVLRLQLISQD